VLAINDVEGNLCGGSDVTRINPCSTINAPHIFK